MAPLAKLTNNRAVRMLDAAAKGKYGVLGVVTYNLETLIACIKAAEAKKSPLQILLFPWAYHYSPLFIDFVAHAIRKATVPVCLHMDHAQDPEVIKKVAMIKAEDGTPAFDSIMVDMSHYEKEENLSLTKELVAICHEQGISTEAEPGRIEGGEDGVKDTAELQGMMTTPEEVDDFCATGIDFLAPAFGNVHGEYGGVENIKLEYDRYAPHSHCHPPKVKSVLTPLPDSRRSKRKRMRRAYRSSCTVLTGFHRTSCKSASTVASRVSTSTSWSWTLTLSTRRRRRARCR